MQLSELKCLYCAILNCDLRLYDIQRETVSKSYSNSDTNVNKMRSFIIKLFCLLAVSERRNKTLIIKTIFRSIIEHCAVFPGNFLCSR